MTKLARDIRALLSHHGWFLLRQGNDDHEIWHHPPTGRKVSVDDGILSRHTANAILKKAGLPKAF